MSFLESIRKTPPLIHHLTNIVTIYDCAQVTRAIGALPVMTRAPEEGEDMVHLAGALVLNIGTLTREDVALQIAVGKAANKKGIPVVFDIVGCGATPLRTQESQHILREVRISILKGNAGEIATLVGAKGEVRGVESIAVSGNVSDIVQKAAKQYNCIVVATGQVDTLSDGDKVIESATGHIFLSQIVGTGCMLASVLACFAAVAENMFDAAYHAVHFYGKVAEKAAKMALGPMDFKGKFLDALFREAKEG